MGLIPAQGTKIPHAVERLSPCASTREKPSRHHCWGRVTNSPSAETLVCGWCTAGGAKETDCDCFFKQSERDRGKEIV